MSRPKRNPLLIDVFIAVVLVAVILVVEPGVAVAAILALVLLIICAISLLVSRRGRRATAVSRVRRG